MSHFSKIRTQIKDLRILKKVLEKFSYSYQDTSVDNKERLLISDYYGKTQSVDIRIRTDKPDNYIGIIKQPDETYSIVADWYGNKIINGKTWNEIDFNNIITKHYGYEQAKANIPRDRFDIVEEQDGIEQETLVIRLIRV